MVFHIKAMLTFRHDLVFLEPISFLLKTLSSCEWAWHTPRMGFQRCKCNYSKTQKHEKTSHTALCSSKALADLSKQCCEDQYREAGHSRHPDRTALTGVRMLSPAHMAARCSILRNLVFIPCSFLSLVFNWPRKMHTHQLKDLSTPETATKSKTVNTYQLIFCGRWIQRKRACFCILHKWDINSRV